MVSLQLYGTADGCVTSCAARILAVAVREQRENKSPRDNQVGKDALCSASCLSKTRLGGDSSSFISRNTGSTVAF